jgi:predicted oxidoreductase
MEKIYLSDAGPKVRQQFMGFYRWNEVNNAAGTMERIINLCLELGSTRLTMQILMALTMRDCLEK